MGYSTLKAALDAVVRTNGQQQITGANLNGVMTTLLQGVDVLDRANPADTSGMSKVVLDKSKTFAEQVTGTNTIYEIRDNFDLGGASFSIPSGCIFVFKGGCVKNGTLQGELLSDKPIDLKSFGLVYNNQSSAGANTANLKILSGVTNRVDLEMSGDLYIGGGAVAKVNWQFLSLNGNGFNIHVENFPGFLVAKDIAMRNCRVYCSQTPIAELIEMTTIGTYHPNLLFENNYFEGDMRVITASGLSSEQGDVYINDVSILNNRFENIRFTIWGNCIFQFTDTAFLTFNVKGNVVHNFFSEFIACGITNESETDHHQTWLYNFYLNKGRNFYVCENLVWNDLDFKPWTKFDAVAYYTFILAETGYCLYENNVIKNIIDKRRDGEPANNMVYDAYLSVDVLDYFCNHIEDCWKYEEGFYLMRSKGSNGGDGIRRYFWNTYVAKDMTSLVDYVPTNVKTFISTQFAVKDLEIKYNVFDLQRFANRSVYAIACETYAFCWNKFKTATIDDSYADMCICNNGSNCRQFIVENNIVDLVTPVAYHFGLFISTAQNVVVNCHMRIANNNLHNCLPIGGDTLLSADANSIVEVVGNKISLDDHQFPVIESGSLSGDGVLLKDNSMKFAKLYPGRPLEYSFMAHRDQVLEAVAVNGTGDMVFRGAFVGTPSAGANPDIYTYMIDVEFMDCGYHFRSFINVTKRLVDGAYKNIVLACAYDGSIVEYDSAQNISLINLVGTCTNGVSTKTNRRLMLGITSSRFELNLRPFAGDKMKINYRRFKVTDFHKLPEYLKTGSSSFRPGILSTTDRGMEFFDETLGKPLFAKTIDASTGAVTWADATGASV